MAEEQAPRQPSDDEGDDEEQPERRVSMKRRDIKALEDKAHRADAAEKEATTLKRKVAILEAGLTLNAKQQQFLFAAHEGDDLSPTALRATAVELGIAVAESPESPDTQAARASSDSIDKAVDGSSSSSGKAVIPPSEVREWPADKIMRFRREHPELIESMKRGQPVKRPVGW